MSCSDLQRDNNTSNTRSACNTTPSEVDARTWKRLGRICEHSRISLCRLELDLRYASYILRLIKSVTPSATWDVITIPDADFLQKGLDSYPFRPEKYNGGNGYGIIAFLIAKPYATQISQSLFQFACHRVTQEQHKGTRHYWKLRYVEASEPGLLCSII